ncbi:putative quinol monooxygenase [Furfurilactobacillus entadae]|uniref:putative quinol monooxygenase n=1 Tax=Furfurilactobacillus entadae TaxID=2922307 RepID=UPI0035EFB5A7
MITINATVYVKPTDVDAYLMFTDALIAGTQSEPGNLRYDMYQSVEHAGEFVFIEQYADQVALDAHHAATHFTDFLAQVTPLLSHDMDVKVFRELPTAE